MNLDRIVTWTQAHANTVRIPGLAPGDTMLHSEIAASALANILKTDNLGSGTTAVATDTTTVRIAFLPQILSVVMHNDYSLTVKIGSRAKIMPAL